MKNCANCGESLGDSARQCTRCGHSASPGLGVEFSAAGERRPQRGAAASARAAVRARGRRLTRWLRSGRKRRLAGAAAAVLAVALAVWAGVAVGRGAAGAASGGGEDAAALRAVQRVFDNLADPSLEEPATIVRNADGKVKVVSFDQARAYLNAILRLGTPALREGVSLEYDVYHDDDAGWLAEIGCVMPEEIVRAMLDESDEEIYAAFSDRILEPVQQTLARFFVDEVAVGVSLYPPGAGEAGYALRVYSPPRGGTGVLGDDPESPGVYRGLAAGGPAGAVLEEYAGAGSASGGGIPGTWRFVETTAAGGFETRYSANYEALSIDGTHITFYYTSPRETPVLRVRYAASGGTRYPLMTTSSGFFMAEYHPESDRVCLMTEEPAYAWYERMP